jgi:hypothetical protein
VDPASPAFKANPYAFYARLRAEEPVCPVVLPDKQVVWLITRYDDVAIVLKDERFAKDRTRALAPEQLKKEPWVPAMFRPLTRNMLDLDPPDHTRLRALVQKAFTPRVVEQVRERIRKLTEDLLDRAMERGRMDLVRDYALPLPTTIIAAARRRAGSAEMAAGASVGSRRCPCICPPRRSLSTRELFLRALAPGAGSTDIIRGGSAWGPVALADFKSVGVAARPGRVGSTPTRFRHFPQQKRHVCSFRCFFRL